MKNLLLFLAGSMLLPSVACAMIDGYSFKVIGRVVSVSDVPVRDEKINDETLQNPYYMQLEILAIIPTESDLNIWAGRYEIKGIQRINSIVGKERTQNSDGEITAYAPVQGLTNAFRCGDIIIGYFSSREVEYHRRGYRVENSLSDCEPFPDNSVNEFFVKRSSELQKLLASRNLNAIVNSIIAAKNNNLTGFSPLILKVLERYYPSGKWEPQETAYLYAQGISAFKQWGFREAAGLLKKIAADEKNARQIGIDFVNIQKSAREALESLTATNR